MKKINFDENARGDKLGFNRVLDSVSKTQRPMNINGHMWSGLIGKSSQKLYDPKDNIEASIILIRRIRDRLESPTAGKIASIWNVIGRENTNDFGNDVDIIYNQKP